MWYRLEYTVVQQGGWRVISWLSSCNKLYYMLSKRSMAATKCTKQYLYTTYMYIYISGEHLAAMACVHFSCIPNENFAAVVSQRQYNTYYHNVLLMQNHQNQLCTHIFLFILFSSSSTLTRDTYVSKILRF